MNEGSVRREFLVRIGRVVLAVPAAAFASRCGGGSDGGMGQSGDGFTATSGTTAGHAHELLVPFDVVESPVAPGVSLTTHGSSPYAIGSHTHVVALSSDQLTSLQRGGTVDVTSSSSAGHAHGFTIRLP